MSTDWGSHQMSTSFFLFRYDLGTMSLNQVGELRKYHQFIGIFSTEKGTFDHKSTNQPNPLKRCRKASHFLFIPVFIRVCEFLLLTTVLY
jgi:hypothetical protein